MLSMPSVAFSRFCLNERVEPVQQTGGLGSGGLDPVEIVFHFGREFHVKYIRKIFHQKVIDDKAQFAGPKITFEHTHISLVPDGGEDGGICAGPSDAVFFQFP